MGWRVSAFSTLPECLAGGLCCESLAIFETGTCNVSHPKSHRDDQGARRQICRLPLSDPRGKWQHLAHRVRTINEDFLNEGVMFDGSSIAGWKAINESDMKLAPDCSTAVLDPFAAQTSLIIFCDVREPLTGKPCARDPRSIAKKAEQHLVATGIGDTAFFGPEAEFFVFDDVRYSASMRGAMYEINSEEAPYVSDKKFPDGNTGHRPSIKGGYFPVLPVDRLSDLRAEMLSVMSEMGLDVEKHHHEAAPSQNELGFVYSTLVRTADNMQIYKHVVQNVAHNTARQRPSFPSRSWATTAPACTRTSLCGRASARFLPATSMPICRRQRSTTSAASSATPRHQRLHQSDDEQLQTADPRLRGASVARLFFA
jgi:hypothetical protein